MLVAVLSSGCATNAAMTPREYLDEQTAATITVVKEPWIFTRELDAPTNLSQRDFLHLYAIDVNRMGDHRQYFALLQSLPSKTPATELPKLELASDEHTMLLEATPIAPRELGIAQPIAEAYTLDARWSYFPVDIETLATLANIRELTATLHVGDEHVPYVLWRNGREELSELTAVLP